jgi:chaperonin GroEL (HSP60 family)
LRCVPAVTEDEAKCEVDEKTGVQILKRALEAPARQIAENSAVAGGVVVARMLGGKDNEGFDATRKEYVDMIEAGIIDPPEGRSDCPRKHRLGCRHPVAHVSNDDRDPRGGKGA